MLKLYCIVGSLLMTLSLFSGTVTVMDAAASDPSARIA
jgi:hypothetical protein